MIKQESENPGQEGGKNPQEPLSVEPLVRVFSFEFRRGIAFKQHSEAAKVAKNSLDYHPTIIVDHTQEPPLYIVSLSSMRLEQDLAKNLGKEMGYDHSYVGVTIQPDSSTHKLHVDFDKIVLTLKKAGVSTSVSGEMLIRQVERIIRDEASIADIKDEDKKEEAYLTYKKGAYILLAQQDGLDVYMGLGDEIKHTLFTFKSGDNLDISGTTLVTPPISYPLQAFNEAERIKFGMILPAIDIRVVPSSRGGTIEIDVAPPNFDSQTLAAGRDLTARIVTAFEALKPKV